MPKSKDKTIYQDDSIRSLNGRDFCRLRPATYLGSNEYSTQLLKEVFANAIDEHVIGHGDLIEVVIGTDNTYTVTDHGQGFPINVVRDDGETVLQAAFDVINTSGKYDGEDGVYMGSSLGANGIGSKLTNFLSKWLVVTTYNNGKLECCHFVDGIFQSRETHDCKHENGTVVSWKPDEQFFQNSSVNRAEVKKLFEDISALCPKLTIKLTVDGKEQTYHSSRGLNDLVDKKANNKEILSSRFNLTREDGNRLFDICLTYTSDYNDNVTAYVNYGLTENGIHISTVKSLMTKQLNKFAKEIGVIKKESEEFTSQEFSEGLLMVFNVKAPDVKYDSQTKTRVVDIDRSLIRKSITNDFYDWLNSNKKDAKTIIDRASLSRKARQAAQKARDGIRNSSVKGKKFISLPTKLVDAYSKDRGECEIYICEGDSAANGIKTKRDGKTQAVFPIRGKILSCRKATMDKVYGNQEISNIVKALGLDINKEDGKLIYDEKKLRYGKIILATDADADGFDIRLLLINMFWWLCPELMTNGHIYAAIPPLFRITNKKNEYKYFRGNKELDEYKKSHKNDSFLINRNKGLGEMDPSELAECIIKPETRDVQQITVEDAKEADNLLEVFMGQDVKVRRDYLLENYNEVENCIG